MTDTNTEHSPEEVDTDTPEQDAGTADNASCEVPTPEAAEATPTETTPEEQAAEYLAGWKRAQADYQNLVKESDQRVSDALKYGTERLLVELFPMVDHFKYAFKGIPEAERESSWLKGIEYIQSNFHKILEEHGVEVVATVGQPFDPELHESVEEVEGGESGIIAEEMSTGFRLNGKVIQHAKVKVYK